MKCPECKKDNVSETEIWDEKEKRNVKIYHCVNCDSIFDEEYGLYE